MWGMMNGLAPRMIQEGNSDRRIGNEEITTNSFLRFGEFFVDRMTRNQHLARSLAVIAL
jgi:hypothetical protein